MLICISIPISFRHSTDPRAKAVKIRLIKEVTPRLAAIVEELANAVNDADIFKMYADSYRFVHLVCLFVFLLFVC